MDAHGVRLEPRLLIYSIRELHQAHSASDGNSNESRNHQDEWVTGVRLVREGVENICSRETTSVGFSGPFNGGVRCIQCAQN